jgi:serine/threonine protein phosphatase PrpC
MKAERRNLQRANGLTAAAATDCGRMRDHNEDTFHLDLDSGIFLVVDGVGGAAAGEVAAAIASDRIRRRLERQDGPADVRVREAITLANREILLKAGTKPEYAGMACVLTLAVLEGRELTIGHVGDSRLYRLDARGISKLTHDHSPIGELEDARTISETDAMRDERRNEVYRDVGSEPRDPEADDFIELVRTRFDDDAAILMCSDGLTDMLPALEVNRIVRLHAGAPDRAVAALIAAANEAGGKDNVTALLVEGPKFRRAPDGGRVYPPPSLEAQVPTLPLADRPVADAEPAAIAGYTARPASQGPAYASASTAGKPSHGGDEGKPDLAARVMRSRGLALVGGVLLGLLVPAGLATFPEHSVIRTATREWIVGGDGAGAFATIGAALETAQPGDVVQVEPGQYAEAINLPGGVELRAAKSGKVVIVAPPDSSNWTAIAANAPNATVRGIKIAGSAASPITRGIAVNAANVTVDDVTFEGEIGVGIDVLADSAIVRSSRFDRLTGAAVRVAHDGALLRQNLFRAATETAPPAIQAVGTSTAAFDANVFEHFPRVVEPAARADDLIGHDNFVIVAPSVDRAPVKASDAAPGKPADARPRGGKAVKSTQRGLRPQPDVSRGAARP